MKYTIKQLNEDCREVNKHLEAIRIDRGKRYGSEEDTLNNVRSADPDNSWRAAYISAYECLMRLRRMFDTPIDEINEADFENATDDLINYAYYIKLLYRQRIYK